MWLILAFCSAALLGLYDVSKKRSLNGNAVLPVLTLNTLFSCLIFLPFIALSASGVLSAGDMMYVEPVDGDVHLLVFLKSLIVLLSWILGYFAIKHLPLTIVGPVNATRPVLVLVGAMLIFGERLNVYQWIGVGLAIISLFLLSRSGKKEGIDFKSNRWVFLLALAAIVGAASGLYDKYLLSERALSPMVVQSWFTIYQFIEMALVLLILWWPRRRQTTPFTWRWSILLISLFLTAADFAYFTALSQDGAMISVVSMIRRGSVIVSFLCGALLFREKNLKNKFFDLLLVLLGLVFLFIGSR